MTDQTILVVDDDPKIRTLLRNVLEGDGYVVLEAEKACDVLALVSDASIDLITLDIHLEPDDGLKVARDIRRISAVPIIMVSGRNDVIDRVVGLEIGADDYITKPFHVREVLARVKSVLRRSAGSQKESQTAKSDSRDEEDPGHGVQFSFDGMTADPDRLELIDRSGADCGLTSGDFKLLSVLLHRAKRVLSRDQLMDLTGGVEWSPLDRTIDNQVARLRKKIERDPSDPKLIKTVRGVGYVFACDVETVQLPGTPAKRA